MSHKIKIEKGGKNLLLAALYIFLLVPLIQELTHFKTYEGKLNGAFVEEKDISFDWPAWFSADYQTQRDKYVKENFGFHNYYIKLICQINFDLFKKPSVAYMVIGKHDYLYEIGYIDAFFGKDFIGEEKIKTYIDKLKRVQDTLEKSNKLLLCVFAAGKASFYPEYIPDSYLQKPKTNNYKCFARTCKELNLNHIDFNSYFQEQKNKTKYPLYPQYGIHWSNYGSMLAFDSIVKFAQYKMKIDLPDLKMGNIELSDSLRNTDNDALLSLNLLFNPKTFEMAYPDWVVNFDSTFHKKLRLLVIADSFWWYIYSTGVPAKTFSSADFWYYNKEVYPESFTSPLKVTDIDYEKRIKEADIILIMHTEATLSKFGGGFVDMCYNTYYNPSQKRGELQRIKEKILSTPEWIKQVQLKAVERKLTVDSMLTLDAIYMLERENN